MAVPLFGLRAGEVGRGPFYQNAVVVKGLIYRAMAALVRGDAQLPTDPDFILEGGFQPIIAVPAQLERTADAFFDWAARYGNNINKIGPNIFREDNGDSATDEVYGYSASPLCD